ncbi:MAG: 50S ribosomal protein L21 [Candidatus Krumholzibacteriia bacterium]
MARRTAMRGNRLDLRSSAMYAVVKIKDQQYRVETDKTVQVPRFTDEVGTALTFGEVMLLGDGDDVRVGTPLVEGASVSAEILSHGLSRKIMIYKKKRRKNYRRKKGHRQPFTEVRITAINA